MVLRNFGEPVKSHKDLGVWRLAIDLAQNVYEVSKGFPRDEQFGMTSQMRRAAVSIGGNIAEGAARNGQREFTQFLYIALGKLCISPACATEAIRVDGKTVRTPCSRPT